MRKEILCGEGLRNDIVIERVNDIDDKKRRRHGNVQQNIKHA